MPLMYSEALEDCQLCIDILNSMIQDLQNSGKDNLANIFQLTKKWALEHLEILQLYGRYPHRNKVLGRDNTEEEDLYLKDAGFFEQQSSSLNN